MTRIIAGLLLFALSVVLNQAWANTSNDEAMYIVRNVTQERYRLSVWSGMHSHETADFNGDQREDLLALIKPGDDRNSEHPPTHILVILGEPGLNAFEKAAHHLTIPLDQGTPGDFPDAFMAVEKREESATFAKIGCTSERAIRMIENASTAFYLCWKEGKFTFMRDPDDTP